MIRAVLIAVGLGLAGLGVSFWLLGEDLGTALKVPAWAYAVGLGLAAANYATGAFRLVLLAARVGHRLPYMGALRAYALGLFTAALTPGSAGQAPAVALSLVKGGMTPADAWTINVRVWILDLVFLAWSLPLSILVLGRSTRILVGSRPEVVAAGAFLLAAFTVVLLLFRLRWLTRLASLLVGVPGVRRWRGSLGAFLQRVEVANAGLKPARPATHAALHLATFVVYFTTYFTFFVVVAAMRPGTSPLVAMASAQVPSVASSFFPTPGGTGLLEVGTASLMRLSSPSARRVDVPVAPEDTGLRGEGFAGATGTAGLLVATDDARRAQAGVAAAILAWRVLTYYLRMVVGLAWGGSLLRKREEP